MTFDVDEQWRVWQGDSKKLRQVMRITVRRLEKEIDELKAANDRMERNCHRYAGELNYRENWLSPSQVVHLLDAERRSMED